MAHLYQMVFCNKVKRKFPSSFYQKKVLDIGSLDIKGNNRCLFQECEYLGIDLGAGKNVDLVCSGGELDKPDNYFDTIISIEAFEHDKNYKETIHNAMRMLKPGGLFLFTCASTKRKEHGTKINIPEDSPFTLDYYKNLVEEDFRNIANFNEVFPKGIFESAFEGVDLYFYGLKVKGSL